MFRAGDEFLNTQFGNNNPYNQDNEIGWLDWNQLRSNEDISRFFKCIIAFRKNHPSLSRSRFWREDISRYGVGPTVDLSHDSHSLAFCLHGASQGDDDFYAIYAMINATGKSWSSMCRKVLHRNGTESWTQRCRVLTISRTTESNSRRGNTCWRRDRSCLASIQEKPCDDGDDVTVRFDKSRKKEGRGKKGAMHSERICEQAIDSHYR
jgi:pullulanase/glycogen debranching enzyme